MFFTQFLNEVYFGKTPEMQRIEKQIGVTRTAINEGRNVARISMNNDPELLKLNDMIADTFGFGIFSLELIDEPTLNAATVPISIRFDIDRTGKALIVDKKKFKFDPKYEYACVCMMYTGIFLNPKFSDAEVFALILHEIGHNFYSCLNRRNGVLSAIYTAVYASSVVVSGLAYEDGAGTLMSLIENTNLYTKFDEKITRKLRENNSVIALIFDCVQYFKSLINTGLHTALGLIDMLTLGTVKLMGSAKSMAKRAMNPMNYIVMPLRYADERAADNFATMYGYGGELASCLTKLEGFDSDPSELYKRYNRIPVVGLLYNTISLPAEIMSSVLEEHPVGIARTQDQLNMLKRELETADLDPKMRKAILADIKVCEAELQKLIDTSAGIQDPKIARHLYNRVLYSVTKSKTLKEILLDDRKKFDRYDKTYFDRLEKQR